MKKRKLVLPVLVLSAALAAAGCAIACEWPVGKVVAAGAGGGSVALMAYAVGNAQRDRKRDVIYTSNRNI